MNKVADRILSFVIIFLFCHGLGSLIFPYVIKDVELALSLSIIASFLAGMLALIYEYFSKKEKRRKENGVIDDIDIK